MICSRVNLLFTKNFSNRYLQPENFPIHGILDISQLFSLDATTCTRLWLFMPATCTCIHMMRLHELLLAKFFGKYILLLQYDSQSHITSPKIIHCERNTLNSHFYYEAYYGDVQNSQDLNHRRILIQCIYVQIDQV